MKYGMIVFFNRVFNRTFVPCDVTQVLKAWIPVYFRAVTPIVRPVQKWQLLNLILSIKLYVPREWIGHSENPKSGCFNIGN